MTAFGTFFTQVLMLAKSPEMTRAIEHFQTAAPRSQQQPEHKAMLYMLARLKDPDLALEIGTFFAGTAQVIAEAVWANGHGLMETVDFDPISAERAPKLIAEWPPELQDVVRFTNTPSAGYLTHFVARAAHGEALDFTFVDGNHDYEFALFDFTGVARFAGPNALIVIDNIILDGVHVATDHFLRLNPAWKMFWYCWNDHDKRFDIEILRHPIGRKRDNGHYVLCAPDGYSVSEVPRAFHYQQFDQRHLVGVRFRFDAPLSHDVEYMILMISRPGNFHEIGTGAVARRTQGVLNTSNSTTNILVEMDLENPHPVDGYSRHLDITLRLTADPEANASVVLRAKPELIWKDGI